MIKMSKTLVSDFYCLCCLKKTPLARRKSNMREKEHLKKLYCFSCKEEVNHYEVREFDADFSLEELKKRIEDGEFEGLTKELEEENV